MIVAEIIDNMVVRHYSDQGVMLRQVETDTLWPDAVDVIPCQFTYEETAVPIPDEDVDEAEVYSILFGGAES